MMKKLLHLILFLSLSNSLFGQSQTEMNQVACDSANKADKELNQVFQKILKDYKEDTVFIKNIKAAQLQWIKLRDADLKAIYTPGEFYGSVEPMCRCFILESKTKERIKFLKTWTEGTVEGDACTGTRKNN